MTEGGGGGQGIWGSSLFVCITPCNCNVEHTNTWLYNDYKADTDVEKNTCLSCVRFSWWPMCPYNFWSSLLRRGQLLKLERGKKKEKGGRRLKDTYGKGEKGGRLGIRRNRQRERKRKRKWPAAAAAAGSDQSAGIWTHFTCLPYRDTGQLTHVHTGSCTHATMKTRPRRRHRRASPSAERHGSWFHTGRGKWCSFSFSRSILSKEGVNEHLNKGTKLEIKALNPAWLVPLTLNSIYLKFTKNFIICKLYVSNKKKSLFILLHKNCLILFPL